MSYDFCSKFHTLSSSAKILKIGQDLTKLQTVKRWELFETQCTYIQLPFRPPAQHGENKNFTKLRQLGYFLNYKLIIMR